MELNRVTFVDKNGDDHEFGFLETSSTKNSNDERKLHCSNLSFFSKFCDRGNMHVNCGEEIGK